MARWLLLAFAAACSARVVETVPACESGRPAAAVAAEYAASLPAAGWRDVVVERHPRFAGRWLVRGVRDGTHIAGRIDDSAEASCRGARVSLSVLEVAAGADRKTAGPTGLSRPSRLPDSPLTR